MPLAAVGSCSQQSSSGAQKAAPHQSPGTKMGLACGPSSSMPLVAMCLVLAAAGKRYLQLANTRVQLNDSVAECIQWETGKLRGNAWVSKGW